MSDQRAGHVRSQGDVIHGVECYEAWREYEPCPHEGRRCPAIRGAYKGYEGAPCDAVLSPADENGWMTCPMCRSAWKDAVA